MYSAFAVCRPSRGYIQVVEVAGVAGPKARVTPLLPNGVLRHGRKEGRGMPALRRAHLHLRYAWGCAA